MKRFFQLLPALLFFIMIVGVMSVGIVQEDKTYSSTENRLLQGFPEISVKKARNGKFQKKYETYLSDQFPQRDLWVKFQTGVERAFGKKESNGVYFGEDGYLLEKYTEKDIDDSIVDRNIKALGKFVKQASREADVKVMMVPSKTYTLKEALPAFARTYDETIFYQKIEKKLPENVMVPVYETLRKHRKEPVFYKTDHHWTTLGAWYGYVSYLEACGKDIENAEPKKKLKKVTDCFLGTTHAKVNMYSQKDEISIYEPKEEMTVVYNLGEKTEHTFYQKKYLKKKDKYSVFFGGNQAVLEISGGVKNKATLLMIKDSFANCFLPFLAEDYENIVVADMRHLNIGVDMLLRKYKPTNVLVLYNTIQFMRDKELFMKVAS